MHELEGNTADEKSHTGSFDSVPLLLARPSISVLLATDALDVSLARAVSAAATEADDLELVSGRDAEGLVVSWSGRRYAIVSLDAPMPRNELSAVMQASEGANDAIARHQAHVIISPFNQPKDQDSALLEAAALMEVGGIIAKGLPALGVLWMASGVIVNPAQFNELRDDAFAGLQDVHNGHSEGMSRLPIAYWVDQRAFSDTNQPGVCAARTVGMRSFIGAELEIGWSEASAVEVRGRLAAMVEYVFSSGAVFEDGQKLQMGDTDQYGVSKEEASGGPVIRFTLLRDGTGVPA